MSDKSETLGTVATSNERVRRNKEEEGENARPGNTEESRVKARPARIPLHERNILTVTGKDPNKEYRWFVDKDSRLADALAAWWEFETNDFLGVGEKRVNPNTQTGHVVAMTSGERTLYLMSIAKELYEQDQDKKQSRLLAQERDYLEELNSGEDGRYGSAYKETASGRRLT